MKVSSKGEYAIRALFDLAQHYEQSTRRSREISEAQGLQEHYLNQLLIDLRKAGLIDSLRGPQGGHVLARPPHQINLYEVVSEMEGGISPVAHNVKRNGLDDVLDVVWNEIEQDTRRILEATTLRDLCEQYRERQQHRDEAMYYI